MLDGQGVAVSGKKMFERTSHSCDLIHMAPELADAIKGWADQEERTSVLAEAVAGCETASTALKRGITARLLGAASQQLCGMLLTPQWLIWALKQGDDAPFVIGVKLAEVEVRDYRSEPEAAVVPDDGVQVFGFIGYSSQRGTVLLGLGDDADGHAFKEKLLAAWRAARD